MTTAATRHACCRWDWEGMTILSRGQSEATNPHQKVLWWRPWNLSEISDPVLPTGFKANVQ